MAIGKAIRFIRQAEGDAELREACCRITSREELLRILDFNIGEFEEAFNGELVKCQTKEEAEALYQLREWFRAICLIDF